MGCQRVLGLRAEPTTHPHTTHSEESLEFRDFLGLKVEGLLFRVQALGLRGIWGLRLQAYGLGFRAWGMVVIGKTTRDYYGLSIPPFPIKDQRGKGLKDEGVLSTMAQ